MIEAMDFFHLLFFDHFQLRVQADIGYGGISKKAQQQEWNKKLPDQLDASESLNELLNHYDGSLKKSED